MKSKRAKARLQYADAELIALGNLVAELGRALGPLPAWASVREGWLARDVTIVGRELVFDSVKAALSARKIDHQEYVHVPPAVLLKLEALGLTADQIIDGATVYFTAPHVRIIPPAERSETRLTVDAPLRARIYYYALRADAAKKWPGIIAPPIGQSPVQAIEPLAPPQSTVQAIEPRKRRKRASPERDAIKAKLDEKFPDEAARRKYPPKAILTLLELPDSKLRTLRRALAPKK